MTMDDTEWLVHKQEGNEHFKQNNIKEAVEAYSKGLELCQSETDKVVLYKNRSACYLKLEKYKEAISDADKVLKAQPNDVKALFRRVQANETLGNIEPAFKDIRILIQREPKNTAIQETFRRLNQTVQEMVSKRNSTSAMITEMVEAIQNPNESEERKKQALSNLVIYSHQSGGRDVLLKGGYLSQLIPVLCQDSTKAMYFMKICHGFSDSSFNQSLMVMRIITDQKFKEIVMRFVDDLEFIRAAMSFCLACIESWCVHFNEVHAMKPEDEGKYVPIVNFNTAVKEALHRVPHFLPMLQLLVALLMNRSCSADVRDAVIDCYIKACILSKACCDFVIENRGVVKLLELASTSVYAMMGKDMPLPVNKDTYQHISVALSEVYVSQDYDTEGRKKYEEQAEGIIKIFMESETFNTNLQGLVALSTLIMANREVGNITAGKNNCVQRVIGIANKAETPTAEKLSAEVLALAATDKEICGALAQSGLPTLRKLYQSKDLEVKVRGLVGLCKVCMKGSGDVKDQILADGKSVKLYKACRKFLLSDKALGLKKWAAEALAYLTMDAETKELLVNDQEALNGLIELGKEGDATVAYSISGTFVNLTNSYDKPEKNPELEAIAKFAKHNIPEPHVLDQEEAVANRTKILIDNGLITALVNFGEVKSTNTKEMIARVFGAIVDDVDYRGKVIAEGGVKALLPLTSKSTTKGCDVATQALAKIGITADPRLAFSGQRSMEVVRPLVKLLHFSKEPLYRFEALMALTNLASMSNEVRRRIMKEKGFMEVESLMFETDDDYRRAATECMCNLVQNEEAFKKFKDEESDRLKLITMYCGEEPLELSRAAAGCLALLTADAEICKRVIDFNSTLEILKFLILNEDLEVRHRGLYIVANLMNSEKEIADKLVTDELFDVLMAYNVSSAGSDQCKVALDRAIEGARKWELIQQNPDA